MGAEVEVQRAIFNKLSTLGTSVVDAGRQAADGGSATPFPYVAIGAIVLAQFDTARENGFDFAARIHTRSRSASMMECKIVQGQIYALLHNAALAGWVDASHWADAVAWVDGDNFILIQRETSDCVREQDGTFHGVCEYRGLIETA